jgi:formate dehydrogenase subunit delta
MAGSQINQLVKMAEQIARNLGAGHDDGIAREKTADHLRRFWTPAMRRQLQDFRRQGGQVSAVVAAALAALAAAEGEENNN